MANGPTSYAFSALLKAAKEKGKLELGLDIVWSDITAKKIEVDAKFLSFLLQSCVASTNPR